MNYLNLSSAFASLTRKRNFNVQTASNLDGAFQHYKCEVCFETFESPQQMLSHCAQHPQLLTRFPGLKDFKSFDGQGANYQSFQEIETRDYRKQSFNCRHCFKFSKIKLFYSANELNVHIAAEHHGGNESGGNGISVHGSILEYNRQDNRVNVPMDAFIQQSPSDLIYSVSETNVHLEQQPASKKFKYETHNKSFSQNLVSITDPEDSMCKKCNQFFCPHFVCQNTTTKKKSFVCKECNKSFKTKEGLFLHDKDKHEKEEVVYVGNKSLQCDVCLKLFGTNQALLHHSVVHKNDSMYRYIPCNVCNKSYKGEIGLGRHMRAVHGIKIKPKCDVCMRSFTTESDLGQHKKSKHEVFKEPENNFNIF